MNRRVLTTVLTVIVILLVLAVGYVGAKKAGINLPGSSSIIKDSGENISDYTAVFLTNGQVYFGKMHKNDSVIDMTDIFYLQVNQQIQPDQKTTENTEDPNVVLVKLGEELHGPNDRMIINKDQVIFTESLKNDSKVVTAINDYKAGKR
ncbi:MAG: hypothetical protein K0S20_44 [Patescibacteria group bacterium]|jgi:hypothetical protein|nr:hypothetical protein [Patescibacteria group bacterium]